MYMYSNSTSIPVHFQTVGLLMDLRTHRADDLYDLFPQFIIQIFQGQDSLRICMICMVCMMQLMLMLPGGSRIVCIIEDVFPGLDLYCCTYPVQYLITAGQDIDSLDRAHNGKLEDVDDQDRDLSVRHMELCTLRQYTTVVLKGRNLKKIISSSPAAQLASRVSVPYRSMRDGYIPWRCPLPKDKARLDVKMKNKWCLHFGPECYVLRFDFERSLPTALPTASNVKKQSKLCLLYTSPSPRDQA